MNHISHFIIHTVGKIKLLDFVTPILKMISICVVNCIPTPVCGTFLTENKRCEVQGVYGTFLTENKRCEVQGVYATFLTENKRCEVQGVYCIYCIAVFPPG